jgi:hypothetical protein
MEPGSWASCLPLRYTPVAVTFLRVQCFLSPLLTH